MQAAPIAISQQILADTFGYRAFRGLQQPIIECLLAGHSALAVLPTGSGKSLCYQIPAIQLPGTGIVISPLISLMQNQVEALLANGVAATYISCHQTQEEQAHIRQALRQGQYSLLYVSPEKVLTASMLDLLSNIEINLFAIDEAHCVSMWGHDFRADYQQLYQLRNLYPEVPLVALTATADTQTRQEILQRLNISADNLFEDSVDRPNLAYWISDSEKNPKQSLKNFILQHHAGQSGIIYCLSRKSVETTAEWMQQQGFNAHPYHAGLSQSLRTKVLQDFLACQDVIVVATIAFGMGIDKPDVRFVAHLNLPKNIESYVQEVGRAGRDGQPANAWMHFSYRDVINIYRMIEQGQADNKRKLVEKNKLQALLGLCETSLCRRQVLLGYFGEQDAPACGNCDNCLQQCDTLDVTTAAQMALSCIYRVGQNYGVKYLIDVLLGNTTDKIKHNNHHQISTFGIGKAHSETTWMKIYRQLIVMNKVSLVHEHYGVLRLNQQSKSVLKGEETIWLRRETVAAPVTTRKKANSSAGQDSEIWQQLKALRLTLAKQYNIPPYAIFHDSTLEELVRYQPQDLIALREISGFGQKKTEKFGHKIVACIKRT